jgi:hypothetical protein
MGNIGSHVDLTSRAPEYQANTPILKSHRSTQTIGARDNELGVMKGSFWQSLVAVLVGNAIYLLVERFLPPRAQHQPYQIDWGLAVDIWICLVCYGVVRMIRRTPPPA